jgi:two-component system, NtrC family, response regulator AtoC
LRQLAERDGRKVEGLSPAVMERLSSYPWPGNIRELKNALEGMVVTTANRILEVSDLPPEIVTFREPTSSLQVPVGATLEDIEKEMIRRTLVSTEGNRTKAAKMLGVSLRTLQRKLKLMESTGSSDLDEREEAKVESR